MSNFDKMVVWLGVRSMNLLNRFVEWCWKISGAIKDEVFK